MYIIEKYWDNYIGSTDDSLTLLEYLIDKKKISAKQRGLDTPIKMDGNIHFTMQLMLLQIWRR